MNSKGPALTESAFLLWSLVKRSFRDLHIIVHFIIWNKWKMKSTICKLFVFYLLHPLLWIWFSGLFLLPLSSGSLCSVCLSFLAFYILCWLPALPSFSFFNKLTFIFIWVKSSLTGVFIKENNFYFLGQCDRALLSRNNS